MRKSIKKMVFIRVAAALLSILLFSCVTTFNLLRIKGMQERNVETVAVLSRAQSADVAHYKWATNLSNALYANTEFTGSKDPTTCILGQWLYGEAGTKDEEFLALRSEMEPLHKTLHESADYVLGLKSTSPSQAQKYYQETIQSNLSTLVGKLDKVIERGNNLNDESSKQMHSTIMMMQAITAFCLVLALSCLISLVRYVLKNVLRPILHITRQVQPLHEGRLDLALDMNTNDEFGDMAGTLEKAMELIRGYIWDLNRIMEQLAKGNFNVRAATPFIGDFRSIEESMEVLTSRLSATIDSICQAQQRVSGNAEHLSSGAQNLAQGATEQASAVEELSATISETALCGLGQSACKPVQSTLKYFRDEYLAHVVDKHCPHCNGRKKVLQIDPELCKGCGKCMRQCPMEAITGQIRMPHVIDTEKCIKCGACWGCCPFGAIREE